MARLASIQDLEILREEIRRKRDPERKEVAICAGTGCLGLGARKVIDAFEKEKRGLEKIISKRRAAPAFAKRNSCGIYPRNLLPGSPMRPELWRRPFSKAGWCSACFTQILQPAKRQYWKMISHFIIIR
jgi:hypothetical protein